MLKFFIISTAIAYISASPIPDDGRIVNGTNAQPGEIPYIVSLRRPTSHTCGGSILDETHILTAAHCVSGSSPSSLTIQYGITRITSDNFQSIGVAQIYVHEEYAPSRGYANDVAVLKLQSPIPLGGDVEAVTLPEQDEAPPASSGAVLAGWGLPYTGGSVMWDLQRVDILVYSDQDCSNAHGSQVSPAYHVCAGVPEGGKGQCSGDSGGPLVANGKQVGVVSWSVKPCTVKGYPGVFARVSSYINWINEKRNL